MERHSEDATDCEVVYSTGCITMSGEIDIANATVTGRRMCAHLTPGNVVVDCRAVTFLDAAGLHMLAQLGVAAIAAGAVVSLRCSPAVTETLNLCDVRELPGLVLDRDDHESPGSPL
jgi:anti-anti-sigma factor